MSSPYTVRDQHKDFALVIGICLLFLALGMDYVRLANVFDSSRRATILVEGMCCEFTARPAVQALTQVSGVLDIVPDYSQKTIRLQLQHTRPTSPKSLWDAVAMSPLRPVRLVVKNETFDSRPVE